VTFWVNGVNIFDSCPLFSVFSTISVSFLLLNMIVRNFIFSLGIKSLLNLSLHTKENSLRLKNLGGPENKSFLFYYRYQWKYEIFRNLRSIIFWKFYEKFSKTNLSWSGNFSTSLLTFPLNQKVFLFLNLKMNCSLVFGPRKKKIRQVLVVRGTCHSSIYFIGHQKIILLEV
jgi:hypothetical protein